VPTITTERAIRLAALALPSDGCQHEERHLPGMQCCRVCYDISLAMIRETRDEEARLLRGGFHHIHHRLRYTEE